MFIISNDGTIRTDSIEDAIAIATRLAGQTAPLDEPIPFKVTKPAAAVPPPPPTVASAKRTPTGRRPRGTGGVSRLGKNWRYSVITNGVKVAKGGFATRELAEAALDAHLSGRAAPPVGETPAPATPDEWGDLEDGLQKHLLCKGSGKVQNPKTGGKTYCRGCDGEGFRRP